MELRLYRYLWFQSPQACCMAFSLRVYFGNKTLNALILKMIASLSLTLIEADT
jgi:hypothetical protein